MNVVATDEHKPWYALVNVTPVVLEGDRTIILNAKLIYTVINPVAKHPTNETSKLETRKKI